MRDDELDELGAIKQTLQDLLRQQEQFAQRLDHLESVLSVAREKVVVSVAPEIQQEPIPEPPPPPPPTALPSAAALDERPAQGLESKVGLTFVNRIGAVTLVLGIAFFFKWAVDNNWIGPAGRVMLGLLAGFLILGGGDFLWRKGQKIFAQGITATGVCIIYLALYAAFGFYHLIPQSAAFVTMVASTAMAAVLALRYGSLAIAALGLAGAYATPLLLSTGEDHPWFLFGYLLLLNVAATELGKRGHWPKLEVLSFGATILIYGGWLLDRGTRHEKRLVATLAPLAFLAQRWLTQYPLLFSLSLLLSASAITMIWYPADPGAFFLVFALAVAGLAFAYLRKHSFAIIAAFAAFWLFYLIHAATGGGGNEFSQSLQISGGFLLFFAWGCWRSRTPEPATEALTLSIFALNAVVYYARAYTLLNARNHLLLGPLAALVAALYLGFALWLQRRRSQDLDAPQNSSLLLALGVALAFLTLAIPIQFTGFTITIAWAIQGAALAWIGSNLKSARATFAAVVVFALVLGRLLLFETDRLGDPHSYSLLINTRFLTFAVSSAAMLVASYFAAKIAKIAALIEYFAGHIVLLWGLILEIFGWAARSAAPANRESVETIAISLLFGVYAVALVSLGVATRTAINRISGLGLFGIVILKLYFFDVWQLARPYQIAAFVILGILLLSTSFLYSRFRRVIETWWKDEKTTV